MKLLVAHRERLVREALRRSLAKGRFDLVALSGDVESLRRDCQKLAPQLLLVELELLGCKAELIPELMRAGAAVVVLAASSAAPGAYEAMGHGALGVLAPPALGEEGEVIGGQRLLSRLERLVGLASSAPAKRIQASLGLPSRHTPVLAIGASTGGPQALAKVLADLPADFEACVLIVQHIEDDFSNGLAEWLGGQCRLPVCLARSGMVPEPGKIYVASPGAHLVLLPSFRFGRQTAQADELHVPGVDALFHSLAGMASPGAAVILTGMGSDGAAGMRELQRRGWYTVAQDEGSSVVFGMPRAALETGAAKHALALPAIGPALVRHFRRRGR